jgi:phosphoribosylformylglycinamidine synthase
VGDGHRLGGSALAQVLRQLGNEVPDIEDPQRLKAVFEAVQDMVRAGAIVACHDVSDGGLIVALLEMAFAGDQGWKVQVQGEELYASLFAEEAGVAVEVADADKVSEILRDYELSAVELGRVGGERVELRFNGEVVLDEAVRELHAIWEETSYQLERLQRNPECAQQEWASHRAHASTKPYWLSFAPDEDPAGFGWPTDTGRVSPRGIAAVPRPKVAIVREEGSNGDREMAAAFLAAGFEPWDITMTDLIGGAATLRDFRMVAFVGGFSFGDVLDSAKGWASVIRNNPRLAEEFDLFFARTDTLSLGVCNGCQLMGLLGIPGFDLPDSLKPRFVRNSSERFESRFSTVRIEPSPAVMLRGMEGSVLGVWVAHGEGRVHVPDPATLEWIVANGLAPVRYVDPEGSPTTAYPYNPNGSPLGIAALCSPDGRHLAIMPHPERTFQLRQWPWVPSEWTCRTSPWLRMFRNAYVACLAGG